MTLAIIHSRAHLGLTAPEVLIEVHLAAGLPAFQLVGLAETTVRDVAETIFWHMALMQNIHLLYLRNHTLT